MIARARRRTGAGAAIGPLAEAIDVASIGGTRHSPIVGRVYGRRDAALRRVLAIADVAGIGLALSLALLDNPVQLLWALATLPAWVVLFKAYGLYDRDMKRIGHSTLDDVPWLFHAMLVGCLVLLGYASLTPPASLGLAELALFGCSGSAIVLALRAAARRLALVALQPERVLLIGEGIQLTVLARKVRAHPEYGLALLGLISTSGDGAGPDDLPLVGSLGDIDLGAVVRSREVDRIIVAHQDLGEGRMLDLLHRSRELGVKISVLPQLFDAMGSSVEVDDVEGLTVLGINPPVLARSSRLLKRTMDLAGAAMLLVVTLPVLAVIAFAVRLSGPGPVLFRQHRIGRGGQRFLLLKFRTMTADAEANREQLLAQSSDPGWLLLANDPRVTRVGRLLRRSSLDELPQLWNVLKGEMSLVGPRPLIESEDRQLEGWRRNRIDLTPGLTGLWQVLGRTSIPFEEMIKLDYLYVTNWSLWTDVRLILRTLPAVLRGRGVN